jgi:hypothetical protein
MTVRSFVLPAAVLTLSLGSPGTAVAAPPLTMRVDYYHTGNATEERFSLDRIVIEPLPWPGGRPIDDTNLGKYFFEVIDRKTNRTIYSRGFASIYGEWETTGEAKSVNRTFHESLRFPSPEGPVQVVLKKRDANNAFREAWSLLVDPAGMFVDRSKPAPPGPLLEIQKSGDPSVKVDFLIVGDGYTAAERPKFEKDARRLADILFTFSPFKERRSDFNVWGLCPPSDESGISRPSTGVHRRSRVGATYDAFGSERYVLTFENRLFRDVAYEPAADRVEPWEPNVTALLDPGKLKWKDLVAADTPVPTPWQKEAYEVHAAAIRTERRKIRAENRPEDEMDALFLRQRDEETKMLGAERYAGKVGAFEGALYEARGYYRPQADCIMFTRDEVGFCAVCRRAIERVIAMYARTAP